MKNKLAFSLFISTILFSTTEIHAQAWLPTPAPIPHDTSHYLVTLASGQHVWMRRPPDTMMNPANLIVRFRPGVLDSSKLSQTYWTYFYGHETKHKGGIQPLSGPFDGTNQPRGFFTGLRQLLFADHFWFDSTNNIVKDTLLRNFLIANGGHFLRRLTAASPIDTLTITRRGDTVPSDLPCWMVLNFDSTVNPLLIAYLLTWEFPKDIAIAYPGYHGGQLDGQPSDLYYTLGYQRGIRMIEADTAWNHEVGDTSIKVEIADEGLDYHHPDFGDTVVGNGHKWMASWNFYWGNNYTDSTQGGTVPDHGTAMSGIIGALSNNRIGSHSPFDTSVAGIAGGHGTLLPDPTSEGRGVTLAAYEASLNGGIDWTASIFESASRSPNTHFGLGVNVINCSEGWYASDTGNDQAPAPYIPAAVNYAYLNGVTFVAAVYELDTGVSYLRNYPSDLDDQWVISVGGSTSIPYKEKIQQSDYGYTLDLLAPAGASDYGANPLTTNYTTRMLTASSPFTYGAYGGTSSATANVSGSAALLLSHFHRQDSTLKSIEPEDIQNILKASAWREDTERLAHTDLAESWVPHNGYGHLDIGHAFEMLDTNINDSPDAGYKLYHSAAISFPLLDSGSWSSFQTGFQFSPPWQEQEMGDTFAVPLTYYLPENISFGYKVRSRSLTFTFTLPDSLENSDTCPLFVWGRSGGAGNPTGWSFEDYPNFETGWTKVTNGTGSDPDSLMDGIFAPSSKVIHLETAQYDVYGWSDSTGSYSHYFGHAPPDPVVAVNFSYFGRAKHPASIVQNGPNLGSDSLVVSVNQAGTMVNAKFFTQQDLPNVKVEFRDVLGRIVYTNQLSHTNYGWNEINLPSNFMASGAYFCVVTAENYFEAKDFLLLK